MSIFLFIFVFLIVIIILGLSIVGAIFRAIFGIGRRSSRSGTTNQQPFGSRTYQQTYQSNQDDASHYNEEESHSEESRHRQKKKIFNKEDGEYVDFEEIKD